MKKNGYSLSSAPRNTKLVLVSVSAGKSINSRLADMGLIPGVILKLIQSHGKGPCVVAVGNTKMMLGKGMSDKIIVREIDE